MTEGGEAGGALLRSKFSQRCLAEGKSSGGDAAAESYATTLTGDMPAGY